MITEGTSTEMEMTMRMFDASTCHIEESTAHWLDDDNTDAIVYEKGRYGWFIPISVGEENLDDMPKDLIALFFYAKGKGCEWLMLDRDGYVNEDLPVYNW